MSKILDPQDKNTVEVVRDNLQAVRLTLYEKDSRSCGLNGRLITGSVSPVVRNLAGIVIAITNTL